MLLCSREAAEAIAGLSAGDPGPVLDALLKLGARNVVVFDESGGAVAANDSERLKIEAFPDPDPPLDLTGAGNAFASTMVTALIRGMPLREALRWPPVNVVATSRQFGAQSGQSTGRRAVRVHGPRPLGPSTCIDCPTSRARVGPSTVPIS